MRNLTVTIECGYKCNNSCVHCNQSEIRKTKGVIGEISFEEIVWKMVSAKEEGASGIAFTGGEPTLRNDLIQLIKTAKNMGFVEIGITTNARRFVYPEYARRLLESGLTSVSVSLHCSIPEIHDSITSVKGAFQQTVTGITNLIDLSNKMGQKLNLSTITVLMPQTLPFLKGTLEFADSLGAKVFVLQPYICSKENLKNARDFLLSLDQIVSGIKNVVKKGLKINGKIKLYNLPLCLFDDIKDITEEQDYRIKTIKDFQRDLKTRIGFVLNGQHVRQGECNHCNRMCLGIRLEHLDHKTMCDAIFEDIIAFKKQHEGDVLTLSCLDLLDSTALYYLLKKVRTAWNYNLRCIWGGFALTDFHDYIKICQDTKVNEVIFLLSPPSARPPDGRVWTGGNMEKIEEDIALIPPSICPSILFVLTMLYRSGFDFDEETLLKLTRRMHDLGGERLYICAPEFINDLEDPLAQEDVTGIVKSFGTLVRRLEHQMIKPILIPLPDGSSNKVQDKVVPLFRYIDRRFGLVQHRFSGLSVGWIMWSNPIWLFPVKDKGFRKPN